MTSTEIGLESNDHAIKCLICNTANPAEAESCRKCGFALSLLKGQILDVPQPQPADTLPPTNIPLKLSEPQTPDPAELVVDTQMISDTTQTSGTSPSSIEEPSPTSVDQIEATTLETVQQSWSSAVHKPARNSRQDAPLVSLLWLREQMSVDWTEVKLLPLAINVTIGVLNLLLALYILALQMVAPAVTAIIRPGITLSDVTGATPTFAWVVAAAAGFTGTIRLLRWREPDFGEDLRRIIYGSGADSTWAFGRWLLLQALATVLAICGPFYIFMDVRQMLGW